MFRLLGLRDFALVLFSVGIVSRGCRWPRTGMDLGVALSEANRRELLILGRFIRHRIGGCRF